MARRVAWTLLGVVAVILLLVGGGIAALIMTDVEGALRGPVERRLEALIGRPVEIAGRFELVPALAPTVAAEDVSVANAPWGSEPTMLQAERIELTLEVLPLLTAGDVLVDRLALVGAHVLVESGPEGLNWASGGNGAEPVAPSRDRRLLLSELLIEDGRLRWRDANGTDAAVAIDRAEWQADAATEALEISAEGRTLDRPFATTGSAGPLADLIDGGDPYPFDLAGSLGDLRFTADGTVVPSDRSGEVATTLAGDRLAALSDLVGVAMPAFGPFRVEALLAADAGAVLSAPELSIVLGGTGGASLTASGAIARLAPLAGVDGTFTLEGEDLAALGQALDIALPATGAYRLEGAVGGAAEAIALDGLTGSVELGRAGTLRVDDGRVDDVVAGAGLHLPLAAEGEQAEPVLAMIGLDVGAFGPYRARAVVTGTADDLAVEDLAVAAGTGAAEVKVEGAVTEVLARPALALDLSSSGESLVALSPLVGVELPPAGRFEIAGHVAGTPRNLQLEGVRAAVAGSQLSGDLSVGLPEGGLPRIEGRIEGHPLDLDRLAAVFGGGPATEGDGADGPTTLPLGPLDDFRADLTLTAAPIVIEGASIPSARADIRLADGKLAIRDFTMRAAEGTVSGRAALARAPTPGPAPATAALTVRLHGEEMDIARLLSGAGLPPEAVGTIEVDLAIESRGRTLDSLLDDLGGDATVVAEQARILDTRLNWLTPDVDLLRILPPFWRRADAIRVNCLVGEFDAESGLVAADALLDTRRMTVLGEGTVDLAAETLDLAIEPTPKGGKLSRTGVPIDIEGPLGAPNIRPRADETVGRLLGGALGGLLVPLNQIAGLFGQETADACSDAVRQAQQPATAEQ